MRKEKHVRVAEVDSYYLKFVESSEMILFSQYDHRVNHKDYDFLINRSENRFQQELPKKGIMNGRKSSEIS